VASQAQVLRRDKFDDANDAAAVAFLLSLLVPALAEILSEKLEETRSFRVVWLELMNEIQVQKDKRVESIKSDIKKHGPQQHPGQALEKLAITLQNAGQRERHLTLVTLKACLVDGGTDNEVRRFLLRSGAKVAETKTW
jgi:hypothetical protein